jgi:mannose/fructose/N-acetylgalactosamine-specific phosphotransferase system component IIB
MSIVLARVDNRLIHGQVLESWIPKMKVTTILVIDNDVADDSLRQAIMEIAVPSRIGCKFFHVNDLKGYLDNGCGHSERIIILFSDIKGALEALRQGIVVGRLNIGNVHYEPGKRRITPTVSLNDEEICWLGEIERQAIVDLRATPDEPIIPLSELLKGAEVQRACEERPRKWWDQIFDRLFKRA